MPPLVIALLAPTAPTVEPLGVAVARLGATAAREVARLPVLVDAPGLGADATLRALAAAVHATLVTDGKALRIERTATDRKAIAAAHRAIVRARVVANLAAWDEVLKAPGDLATQVRAARARRDAALRAQLDALTGGRPTTLPPTAHAFPEPMTPASRLLRAVMDRLGPDRLAALAPGEACYLSDRPNAAESTLPNVADLVETYLRTQAIYARAMDLPEPERPAKIVVSLNEGGADLELYDTKGGRADRGAIRYASFGTLPALPAPPAATPSFVPLGEDTRRLWAIFQPPSGTVVRLTPAALPETYLHPERFDPLGFEVRDALLALPRGAGTKGTVAALTDGLLGTADACVKDGCLDATAFAWRLTHQGGYERIAQNGVELVRPQDPLDAEAAFVDRGALGRGIRRVVADGGETLGNWPALHLALYTGEDQPVADRDLSPLGRLGHSNLDGYSLPPGGWALLGAALQAGKGEATGSTPPFDRLLADGVARGWLRFVRLAGASDLDAAPSSLLAAMPGARLALDSRSVTVAKVYGGFDANGPIRLAFEETDLEGIRREFASAQEPEALGADMALPGRRLLGKPDRPVTDGDRRDADRRIQGLRYLLGNRTDLGVSVFVGKGLLARAEARDWTVDRRGTAFADLPPTFRDAILRGAQNALRGG